MGATRISHRKLERWRRMFPDHRSALSIRIHGAEVASCHSSRGMLVCRNVHHIAIDRMNSDLLTSSPKNGTTTWSADTAGHVDKV